MSILDTIKGLFAGDGLSGILESTGLSDHVDGLLGDGSEIAENAGMDLGQMTESLGLDGIAEALPGDGIPGMKPEGIS